MGTYGLLRFGIQLFPSMAVDAAPVFLALGALGIVYGALLAMAQTDLKRLIACSSVSHLGYVVLGLFALTRIGIAGSVLQMVNHGLSTSRNRRPVESPWFTICSTLPAMPIRVRAKRPSTT